MENADLLLNPPAFDPVVAYGIGGLALLVVVGWVILAARAGRRTAVAFGLALTTAMVLSAITALSGVLIRFDTFPPPMALLIVSVFALGFWMGCSRLGGEVAKAVPMAALIGFQAFRLPLELVMHRAAVGGTMPIELSYAGYNFDILTGAGALLLLVWYSVTHHIPRAAVFAWNVWGTYCLAAIAFIAIASSPMIRFFGDGPDHINSWVLFFPYVWLPVSMVSVAIAGHVLIWRSLKS
jgi:hypothetical protein